jgi:hypothetical protein
MTILSRVDSRRVFSIFGENHGGMTVSSVCGPRCFFTGWVVNWGEDDTCHWIGGGLSQDGQRGSAELVQTKLRE